MNHSILRIVVFSFLIALIPFHTALAITSRDVLRSVLQNDPTAKYLNIDNLPGMSVPYHTAQQFNTPPITNNFTTRYTFTDQEKDDETGLLYFGSRYYDPVIGRFTQPDPAIIDPTRPEFREAMFNPQLLNTYSYVVNNPVKMVDKEGEHPVLALLAYLPTIVSAATIALPMIPAMFENPALTAQATIRTSPISGDVIDIAELSTGRDLFTGQQFSGLERGAMVVGTLTPFVSNTIARSLTKTEAVQKFVRLLDRVSITKQLDNLSGKTINDTIKIPHDWKIAPSDRGGGYRYFDPLDPYNEIRVMPGTPNSPNYVGPYVKVRNRGAGGYTDIQGNTVKNQSTESHIPIKKINQ